MRCRLTHVGGSSEMSPAAWRSIADAGGGPHVVADLASVDDDVGGALGQAAEEEPGGVPAGRLGRGVPVGERQQVGGGQDEAGLLAGLAHRGGAGAVEAGAVDVLDPAAGEHPQAPEGLALGLAQHQALQTLGRVAHQHHGGGIVDRGLAGSAGQQLDHGGKDATPVDRRVRWRSATGHGVRSGGGGVPGATAVAPGGSGWPCASASATVSTAAPLAPQPATRQVRRPPPGPTASTTQGRRNTSRAATPTQREQTPAPRRRRSPAAAVRRPGPRRPRRHDHQHDDQDGAADRR